MSTTRNRIAEISYDFENLRKRIIEEETFTDGERDAYDELFLHKEVSHIDTSLTCTGNKNY